MVARRGIGGPGRERMEGFTKEHKETFECSGCVHSPNCGDGFTGVYMCVSNSAF